MTEVDFFYSYFYDHVCTTFSDSEELNEMAKYYLEKCCNVLENTSVIRMPLPYNCSDRKVIAPIFFENRNGDLLYNRNLEYAVVTEDKTAIMEETDAFIRELLPLFKQQVEVIKI